MFQNINLLNDNLPLKRLIMKSDDTGTVLEIKDLLEELVAQKQDGRLSAFVSSANKNNTELDITLFIGGFLVSGALIGYEKYVEIEADILFDHCVTNDDNINDEQYKKDKQAHIGVCNDVDYDKTPLFIHLKNVVVSDLQRNASIKFAGQHSIWRGKLSEVQGYYLGSPVVE